MHEGVNALKPFEPCDSREQAVVLTRNDAENARELEHGPP